VTRDTPSLPALAASLGCTPDEVARLLAALPNSATNERRREMFRLRYEQGMTLVEVGDRFGVTREAVRGQLHAMVRDLGLLRDGLYGLPARVAQLGPGDLREAVRSLPDLDCRKILLTKNVGRATLREVRAFLKSRGQNMRCGCPDSPCEIALGGPVIRTPHSRSRPP
jgi:hypothetical protein